MLRSVRALIGFNLRATDGRIGEVEDIFFDDLVWAARYLLVQTGNWLLQRRVLISPAAAARPDWAAHEIPVDLTRGQVEGSPEIDLDEPVSRQQEIVLHDYYGWMPYWDGLTTPNVAVAHLEAAAREEQLQRQRQDPHLRSAREVLGYDLQARDGEIGHVDDFLLDEETWALQYLIIDTRDWLPGRRVLIAPHWVEGIVWEESRIHVDLARETIRNSPEYDPHEFDREYEEALYDYYGRTKYWV